MKLKRGIILFSFVLVCATFFGCVDQHQKRNVSQNEENANTKAVPKIIATSYSTVTLCDLLEIPLIAVPKSQREMPKRYNELPEVGSPMGPDMELILSLNPTDVIGPDSLKDQFQRKYEAANIPYTFLNLRSVEGLYDSIHILGEKYDKQDLAKKAIDEYENTLKQFKKMRGDKTPPKVLILMGFPGSYCQATKQSYVGNLVELAGGINVVENEDDDFVSLNTEALMLLEPDYILWTAHALPDKVGKMFQKEFETNDIWKHFTAVKEGRVVKLDDSLFHMSANFKWPKALEFLHNLFYGVKGD